MYVVKAGVGLNIITIFATGKKKRKKIPPFYKLSCVALFFGDCIDQTHSKIDHNTRDVPMHILSSKLAESTVKYEKFANSSYQINFNCFLVGLTYSLGIATYDLNSYPDWAYSCGNSSRIVV